MVQLKLVYSDQVSYSYGKDFYRIEYLLKQRIEIFVEDVCLDVVGPISIYDILALAVLTGQILIKRTLRYDLYVWVTSDSVK